jgi:hypothetical protein
MDTSTIRRVGLFALAVPSLVDVLTVPLTDGEHPPYPVAVLATLLGVVSLGLVGRALRDPSGSLRLLVGLRVLSAVTALPAFVVDGVPSGAQAVAGVVVVLAAVGVLLVARGNTAVVAS